MLSLCSRASAKEDEGLVGLEVAHILYCLLPSAIVRCVECCVTHGLVVGHVS